MLQKPNDKVKYCYQRASCCRERAARAHDPDLKASYLKMEEHWLGLARSFELTEAVSLFSKEVRRFLVP